MTWTPTRHHSDWDSNPTINRAPRLPAAASSFELPPGRVRRPHLVLQRLRNSRPVPTAHQDTAPRPASASGARGSGALSSARHPLPQTTKQGHCEPRTRVGATAHTSLRSLSGCAEGAFCRDLLRSADMELASSRGEMPSSDTSRVFRVRPAPF